MPSMVPDGAAAAATSAGPTHTQVLRGVMCVHGLHDILNTTRNNTQILQIT